MLRPFRNLTGVLAFAAAIAFKTHGTVRIHAAAVAGGAGRILVIYFFNHGIDTSG